MTTTMMPLPVDPIDPKSPLKTLVVLAFPHYGLGMINAQGHLVWAGFYPGHMPSEQALVGVLRLCQESGMWQAWRQGAHPPSYPRWTHTISPVLPDVAPLSVSVQDHQQKIISQPCPFGDIPIDFTHDNRTKQPETINEMGSAGSDCMDGMDRFDGSKVSCLSTESIHLTCIPQHSEMFPIFSGEWIAGDGLDHQQQSPSFWAEEPGNRFLDCADGLMFFADGIFSSQTFSCHSPICSSHDQHIKTLLRHQPLGGQLNTCQAPHFTQPCVHHSLFDSSEPTKFQLDKSVEVLPKPADNTSTPHSPCQSHSQGEESNRAPQNAHVCLHALKNSPQMFKDNGLVVVKSSDMAASKEALSVVTVAQPGPFTALRAGVAFAEGIACAVGARANIVPSLCDLPFFCQRAVAVYTGSGRWITPEGAVLPAHPPGEYDRLDQNVSPKSMLMWMTWLARSS